MKFKDLEGKTIKEAVHMKEPDYDDEAWLKLTFTDGTSCLLFADYGGYTGDSFDEYPTFIRIVEVAEFNINKLVEVKDG